MSFEVWGITFRWWEVALGVLLAVPWVLTGFGVLPLRQGLLVAVGWMLVVLGCADIAEHWDSP